MSKHYHVLRKNKNGAAVLFFLFEEKTKLYFIETTYQFNAHKNCFHHFHLAFTSTRGDCRFQVENKWNLCSVTFRFDEMYDYILRFTKAACINPRVCKKMRKGKRNDPFLRKALSHFYVRLTQKVARKAYHLRQGTYTFFTFFLNECQTPVKTPKGLRGLF